MVNRPSEEVEGAGIVPVSTDIPPQIIIQTGRYIEGFPTWFKNMFLCIVSFSLVFLPRGTHDGICIMVYPM